MKLPYRTTSAAVIGALVILIASTYLLPNAEQPLPRDEAVRWDPCSAWVNYGSMHGLATLVSLVAGIVFTVRGLQNRSGPLWLAVTGLLSLILVLEGIWWQLSARCFGQTNFVASCIWYGSVAAMFIHHGVRYRRDRQRRDGGFKNLTYRIIVVGFVGVTVVWFGMYQYALVVNSVLKQKPQALEQLASAIQATIAVPAYLLFAVAIAVTLWQRKQSRPN